MIIQQITCSKVIHKLMRWRTTLKYSHLLLFAGGMPEILISTIHRMITMNTITRMQQKKKRPNNRLLHWDEWISFKFLLHRPKSLERIKIFECDFHQSIAKNFYFQSTPNLNHFERFHDFIETHWNVLLVKSRDNAVSHVSKMKDIASELLFFVFLFWSQCT